MRKLGGKGIIFQVQFLALITKVVSQAQNDVDYWNLERPRDMANIATLEVMCGKTYMEVQIGFDKPFNGIIFSKGAVDQYNCIYVKPQTGSISYTFNILYDQCGTKPDMNGKFYENNIVIQYDKDLIEVWDEAKRLRCEWYNDYEKGITKPPIRVSDLEVVELNFRGDNVDCWMEIQHGKGPWASLVNGIVPLGTTLTMVIGITDKQGEFDMRVKSCSAEAENTPAIQLTDEHGCVLRPKMISKFMKIAGADERASVVTYAFFHAFKFPDSMSVNIRCKVEICRFGCPDHCQRPNNYNRREQEVSASVLVPKYQPGPRFEAQRTEDSKAVQNENTDVSEAQRSFLKDKPLNYDRNFYQNYGDQQLKKMPELEKKSKKSDFFGIKLPQLPKLPLFFKDSEPSMDKPVALAENVPVHRNIVKKQPLVYPSRQKQINGDKMSQLSAFPVGPRGLRLDKNKANLRQKRSEEMGVTSKYQVISEADLAFKPSFESGMGVTVFQGQMMPEEIVYGVCLPATGFSALFVVVSLLTIVAVLVSGFLCYHKQIEKQMEKNAPTKRLEKKDNAHSLIKLPIS